MSRIILLKADGQEIPISESELNAELIALRNAEIKQLETDVASVSEINDTLAGCLHEQGSELEYLDYLIDDAKYNVESGTTHLQQAEKYQNSYRYRIFAVAATIGTVIAGTIGYTVLSRPRESSK
jgi:syntaxin 16